MHKGQSEGTRGTTVITQAQADSCCAASEGERSSKSNPSTVTPISIAVLGAGVVLPVPVPALVLSDAWRATAPIPIAAIPKHVLLSVFLV
jgi:hypothetical protein